MKFLASAIVLVAAALQVSAGPVEKTGHVCKGGLVKAQKSVSRTIQVGGKNISLTNYKCAEGFSAEFLAEVPAAPQPELSERSDSSLHLEARQRGACIQYSPPICQSTALCNNFVCNARNALIPTEADCNVISNALYIDGTFLTDPLTYWELPYNTCVFRWANLQSSGILEYSYKDWSSTGSIVWNNCIRVSPQLGRNGGYCTPYAYPYKYFSQTTYVTFGLP